VIAATMFSGIGAPEVAMPHWDWRWHADIEKFPNAVMAAHHPKSLNLGDVNGKGFAARAAKIGRPSVIVFGSPCQDFSVAGNRVGLDGARGNLALAALRTIDRLKPRWFVFENVPGLLSSYSGSAEAEREIRDRGIRGDAGVGAYADSQEDSDFAAFLSLVDELGYSGAWTSLDAQFRGLAQRRDRLFFVGCIGDWRGPAAVLFEPESLCGYHPPSREAGEGVAPTTASRSRSGGLGTDLGFDNQGHSAAGRQNASAETFVIQERAVCENPNAGPGAPSDIFPPLSADADKGDQEAIVFQTRIARNGRGQPSNVVPALNGVDAGDTSDMRPVVAFGSQVRRLTPRECERLQGFPDDYTLIQYGGKPASDSPRYKALGNSMAVPVIRMILERIEMFEGLPT
jgi:DNA (cytosine-5)-methyltransferase 1